MGGHHVDEQAGRAWQKRRAADFRAEQQRRLGSSGAAGPVRRIDARTGAVIEIIPPAEAAAGLTDAASGALGKITTPAETTHQQPAPSAEAIRQQRTRDRQRAGLKSIRLDIHEHRVGQALITSGRLSEADALHEDRVAAELERLICDFVQRWLGESHA